jgi:ribosomal protein L16 Arg81 hydroxylase
MEVDMLRIFLILSLLGMVSCESKQKSTEPVEMSGEAGAPSEIKIKNATPEAAVKNFYDAVSEEKFDLAWNELSKNSQNKFIKMVADDEKMPEAEVRKLFEENRKSIQLGFWKSFRDSSKLAQYAPGAQYEVLSQEDGKSMVQMKSGEMVLDSQVVLEGGSWKMGYAESFLN